MKVEMSWTQRVIEASIINTGVTQIYLPGFIQDPLESGDYWVTDGYIIHKAFYSKDLKSWGIYQPDKYGVTRQCIQLDDMNFDIKWYSDMIPPSIKGLIN